MKNIFMIIGIILFQMLFSQSKTGTDLVFRSQSNFSETLNQLRQILKEKEIKIFAEIDHSQAAKEVGMELKPATVFIVGNPKAGTPIMQEDIYAAIELPLRILVAESSGEVRLIYQRVSPLAEAYYLYNSKVRLKTIDTNIEKLLSAYFSKIEPNLQGRIK